MKLLISLTIIVLIIGVLGFLLVDIYIIDRSDDRKAYACKVQIEHLSIALENFKDDTGNYPSQTQGLIALIQKPENINKSSWKGPYLEKLELPLDAWGNSYVYKHPGLSNKNTYDLYSLGKDGMTATSGNDIDDINNWNKKEAGM